MNKKVNNLKIHTISLQKLARKMKLKTGDQLLLCGYSDNRNIQSDAHKIREEQRTDFKVSQRRMIIIDPDTLVMSYC